MPPRRDAGRPRGEPIEQAILAAALEDLATHGLEGLTIARIAEAAEVNKTTVYRRWPTREALVTAALKQALDQTATELRDTGCLAGDLRQVVASTAARLQSPGGRALATAAMSEAMAPSVLELRREELVSGASGMLALMRRAVERGEWDLQAHRPDAVVSMLAGAVFHRVLMEHQDVDAAWIDAVVAVICRGVRPDSNA